MAATALALTACGSSNASQKAAKSDSSMPADSSSSSSSSTSGTDLASVNACALLTAADVNSVAQVDKLDSAQTASTVYTLKASKVDGIDGDSVCSFEIDDPAAYMREGTIEFIVSTASTISDYNDGAKVSGLGDEAYAIGSTGFAVRVGGLLLVAEEQDYFTAATVTALVRKMIPRLK